MGIHSFTNGTTSAPPPPPSSGGLPSAPLAAPPQDAPGMLINYNERFGGSSAALFRDRLIQQAIAVLIRQKKPNPLLLGPAGVGKTRVVEEIARLIATSDPLVPPRLAKSTIWELPLGALVAGAGVVGQLEQRVLELIDFIIDPANDAILFIDEVHLLAKQNDPTYSKVAQLLKPAMARGDLRLIAATTAQEARTLDDDPAFTRRFGQLIVDELTTDQTVMVLESALTSLLQHYNGRVNVPAGLLAEVVEVSEEFKRADQHRPDSALTLLDQSMADLLTSHHTMVARSAAQGLLLNQATGLQAPVTLVRDKLATVARRIASGNAEPPDSGLATVSAQFAAQLLGQARACSEITDAMLRDSLQLVPRTRPATWMFAGPSGVGKTEAAKIMAEHLTGQKPIMLNLAEYSQPHDQAKLLGSNPGYIGSDSNKELPFDTLESNPYRLILLDELEKAHADIHRLLLGALDEGWLRMASGKIVDFSKAIIVATTNAGAEEFQRKSIGFGAAGAVRTLSNSEVTSALQRHGFAPEFLGRFEHVVTFDNLGLDVYTDIVRAELLKLSANPALSNRGLVVPAIPDGDVTASAEGSFDPALGARPAQRAARRLLEDALLAANPLLATP